MEEPVILDTKILSVHGRIKRIRRYLKGIHPSRGTIERGITGWETVEETEVFIPTIIFNVVENHENPH